MSELFVRLLAKVTSRPDGDWGDVGFAYFEALYAAGITTRVFANGPGELASGRWAIHAADFLRQVPRDGYINVAVGSPREVSLSMTKGVRNVVITEVGRRPPERNEVVILRLAELVIVPDEEQVARMNAHSIKASVIPPAKFAAAILQLPALPWKF